MTHTLKFTSADPARPVNGLTWEGEEHQADAAGIIEAPAAALEAALAHGLVPAPTEPTPAPDGQQVRQTPPTLAETLKALPNKGALVTYAAEHYQLELNERDTREELEGAILQADAAKKAAE